jgi:hypothetical protein
MSYLDDAKALCEQSKRDLPAMMRPPYGAAVQKMLDGSIKR